MTWHLRSTVADDAPDVAALHRNSREQAMPWLPDLHTPAEDLAFFGREIPSSIGWVAVDRDSDAILGFALTSEGWLNHLYVDPGSQGTGVGSAMLRQATNHVGSGLRLWAFLRNANARAFFARRGFVEVERTDRQGNQEKEPDVLLVWA